MDRYETVVEVNDDGQHNKNIGREGFNDAFAKCPVCNTRGMALSTLSISGRPFLRKALTHIVFTDTWVSKDNLLDTDFKFSVRMMIWLMM